MKNKKPHNLKGCKCPKGSDIIFCLGTTPVKPKTIEEIIGYDAGLVEKIKQLIADEVIGEYETPIIKSEYPELGNLKLTQQSLKKL